MSGAAHYPERFGPFILLRELGAGGMGSAFLALHQESEALLVVKRMHPELMRDDTIFKRFVHEAEVAAHVRHPNVAGLVAMGTIDREPFLATEFVFGIQVSQIVDRVEQQIVDPVPLDVALFMALELLSGLEGIHEACHHETGAPLGLIHRDVGARNVLVGFDGQVRLIDLGLGKSILSDWQTAHQVLAGSPDYMPPEQAMGAKVDKRADVYAAAVTIWEMIAGKKRIREDSVAARLSRAVGAQPEPLRPYRTEATPRLEAILKQAMATDPDVRTPAASLLARTLEEELRAFKKRAERRDVIEWLDAACATVIARERRLLDDAVASAKNLGAPRKNPHTQMYVQARHGPFSEAHAYKFYDAGTRAPDPSDAIGEASKLSKTMDRIGGSETLGALAALADPTNLRNAPLWVKLAGGMFAFIFVVLVSSVTYVLVVPQPRVATPLPVAPAPPPKIVEAPPPPPPTEVELVAPPPTPPVTPPPLPVAPPPPPSTTIVRESADVQERKKQLVARIRDLRRVKYEVRWQKRLTSLSAKLSSARSQRSLDSIERSIRQMERE